MRAPDAAYSGGTTPKPYADHSDMAQRVAARLAVLERPGRLGVGSAQPSSGVEPAPVASGGCSGWPAERRRAEPSAAQLVPMSCAGCRANRMTRAGHDGRMYCSACNVAALTAPSAVGSF